MKFLTTLIALTSLNVCASSWVYSDEKDIMTNISIYKAEVIHADITAKFQCNYPDGVAMGIYTKSDGLSIASGQLGLRYKIDNSDVFTDNVPVFQKEGMLHFKIPDDLFYDSKDYLVSGKTLKIELSDSFEDKVYREVSLYNSSKTLQKAFTKCNAVFKEVAETKRVAALIAAKAANTAEQRVSEEAQIVQSINRLINDRVSASWVRPASARNNMKTQLRIYFLPNGVVKSAQVTKSSGDALFDQRALDSVYKVGKIEEIGELDSYVFERNFSQIDLIFNPQDLRG